MPRFPDDVTRLFSEGTLHLEVGGVPTSWLRYRYPLLEPPEHIEGVPIPVVSMLDALAEL